MDSSTPDSQNPEIDSVINQRYKHGFVTDIASELAPKGLNEEIVRYISAKKEEPEWLLNWRLKAFEIFQGMEEPDLELDLCGQPRSHPKIGNQWAISGNNQE